MIIYITPTDNPPEFLRGAIDLQRRETNDGRYLFGIGQPWEIDLPDNKIALSDGVYFGTIGDVVPEALAKKLTWVACAPATDQHGRSWYVPCVLDHAGNVNVIASYDENYLPTYSEPQKRLIAIAQAAREALRLSIENPLAGIDFSLAARWATEAIAATNHIPALVILRLGMLDDALILSTLEQLTGFALKKLADEVA